MDNKSFFRAVNKGNFSEFKAHIKENPNLFYIIDSDGKTPLHIASESGSLQIVRHLISKKVKAE